MLKKNISKKIGIIVLIIVASSIFIKVYFMNPIDVGKRVLEETFSSSVDTIKITQEQSDKIIKFYKSADEYNLPYPELNYKNREIVLNQINQHVFIPKYHKLSNGNYGVDFYFEYIIFGSAYDIQTKYHGIIYFELNKTGINKWEVENVLISKISPYKDGRWSSEFE